MTRRLNYYLAAFFFNAFPLPQREAGARQTLRYIGEVTGAGFSVLIFPEGVRSDTGEMTTFRGGIGMIGSRLALPVVPVRIDGVHRILSIKSKMARPGRVTVAFGAPIRLKGDDYAALAKQVEEAVQRPLTGLACDGRSRCCACAEHGLGTLRGRAGCASLRRTQFALQSLLRSRLPACAASPAPKEPCSPKRATFRTTP